MNNKMKLNLDEMYVLYYLVEKEQYEVMEENIDYDRLLAILKKKKEQITCYDRFELKGEDND